jgi:hypothetical protein
MKIGKSFAERACGTFSTAKTKSEAQRTGRDARSPTGALES